MKLLDRRRWVVAAALLGLAACGQPSETILVEMSSGGSPPSGVSRVAMTFEQIRVQVNVPGQGPQWEVVLGDEQGGRTYDLAGLSSPALVAEADVPRGSLMAVEVSLDTDEAPEPGVLPINGSTVVQLPLSVAEGDTARLLLTWDLSQCVTLADGGMPELHLAPGVEVLP